MQKATVLAVDDDNNLQVVLRQYLEQDGYKFVQAANGSEMLEKIDSAQPDVILLDLMLPDHDGLTLISSIRGRSKAGIIVVSGKSETTDRVVGLEMGADDYLTKPFEMRELSARIKALLRRGPATPGDDKAGGDQSKITKIVFGNWTPRSPAIPAFRNGLE